MIDFGTVRPGTTLLIPFHAFDSNDPSASTTISGLATTDIEVYKGGSTTQRASDSGYALLDTDGIDLDGMMGINGISIDLADNTTAGFYAAGSQYWVVIGPITVDAATVNFIAATFRIGYPDAWLNTTISGAPGSQTSFVLASGPAEDDALNGCVVCVHDVASAVQAGFAVISDYTGASKTVTLAAATTFTIADTDNVAIYPPSNARWAGQAATTAQTGDAYAIVNSGTHGNAALKTLIDTIDDFLDTEIAAILADTNELQTDWANGGRLDLILDARASQTSVDDLPTNAELSTALAAADDATLAAIAALNNLSSAGAQSAAEAALAAYGAATAAALAAVAADLPQRITKNTALAKFPFVMSDSADHITPKTGLTITATRSLDGASFGACANSAVEIANGWYYIDLAAADLNGNTVALRFNATGADTRNITIITQPT